MTAIRGERPGGVIDHHISAVTKHLGLDTDRRDKTRVTRGHPDLFHAADCLRQSAGQVAVRGGELVGELVVAALERRVALGDQDAFVRVADAFDVHAESEAVEQLRSQLTFFGVHRADEDEARRVAEGDALAFDDVDSHRGGVEQYVDEVVVEQVDLVDVEDVAICLGQDARLETLGPGPQRGLDVARADDAVLRGVDRQLDHAHAALVVRKGACGFQTGTTVGAEGVLVGRVAAEVAALDHVVLGQ